MKKNTIMILICGVVVWTAICNAWSFWGCFRMSLGSAASGFYNAYPAHPLWHFASGEVYLGGAFAWLVVWLIYCLIRIVDNKKTQQYSACSRKR